MATICELAVDMHCKSCSDTVERVLKPVEGITHLKIDVAQKSVVIEGTAPYLTLVNLLKEAGLDVAVVGQSAVIANLGAAVSQFVGPLFVGIISFVQVTEQDCVVEVDITGPSGSTMGISRLGDLRANYSHVQEYFSTSTCAKEHFSDLGNFSRVSDVTHYQAKFTLTFSVYDIIGRALCIRSAATGSILEAVVIVRSAGVFENSKRLCACDGTSIWEASK